MELDRPLPQPITPEAKPYWDGLKAGKLMLPKCRDCGRAFWYPRTLCPACHSRAIEWIQSSGKGKLHAFGIAQQSFNRAFKVPSPFVLAMVELAEGPRLMTNLVGIEPDPARIRIGMPVEVVFEDVTPAVTLARFRPAGAAR